MVTLLAKWIIGAPPDKTSEESRARYGALCGGVGIGLNIVLFLIKLLAGIFSARSPSRPTPSTTCRTPAPP